MKLKKIVCLITAFFPMGKSLRGRVYSAVYKISPDKRLRVGYGSILDVTRMEVGKNASVGRMVKIKNLDQLVIGEGSSIGTRTQAIGPLASVKYEYTEFVLGDQSTISNGQHYFDVVAPIRIGDQVVFGGKWTQVFTHSFDLEKNRVSAPVTIGSNVFIGAGSLINLGVSICDHVVIQGGTVVNESILCEGVYSSNSLTKVGNIHSYEELFGTKKDGSFSNGKNSYHIEKKTEEH